ncbi:MAG: molybdopterin-dependent oxidoreductase [Planctomycetes bacterium]|nr:molybdopterin-dependent oxidoreductase [Planctomycetota bacterium]
MKHIDAVAHTRGESQYVDDMPRPADLLYAAVVPSPIAHGKISILEIDRARQLDGVVAVLTAKDIPGENQIGPIIQDELLLAEDEVHYIGQPLAIVVAESSQIARKAVKQIGLEIDELPIITDPRQAYEKGEIIGTPRTFVLGDVDSAWDQSDQIVEGRCDIGGQEHIYLETQRARAIPLEDKIRIYSSTQSPYATQRMAAKILNMPLNSIEVDVKRLGGGFGGKEDQAAPWASMAALGAWYTKGPVELVLNRIEDIKMTGKRHPYSSDFKLGLTNEGKILAYEVKHYQNSGAAADLSPAILERTLFHSTNSYYVPNVRAYAVCCRTNLPPNTAFRGFGGPQGMFVIESAITKAAEKLGLPREEIQYKNLLRDNDMLPYGQRVHNGRARLTWDTVVEKYDRAEIDRRVHNFNQTHFETKKGYAIMPICFGISFTSTFMNQAGALVHVYTDGSVSVTTGGIEMGQGLSTNIAAIAARTFGIKPERIKIETTNTTRVANMSPSAASACTHLNGHATMIAVNRILDRLKRLLAKELDISSVDKITIDDEIIFYDGHETGWSWKQLVQKAYFSRVDLSAHGYFATPNIYFDRAKEIGRPFAYHVYGTAIVEVSLDCLRGTYDVTAVKIVHDIGRPLNRLIDLGQVEGALAQGLGWLTLEDLRFNEKGEYLSDTLATYKLPDVHFMPDDIEVTFLENADEPQGPYGNKAVGEPPFMYGLGVFFALRQAMRAFRPDIEFNFDTPLTPERILLDLYAADLPTLFSGKKQPAKIVKPAVA